jgi:GT2 family glycosyltransferase
MKKIALVTVNFGGLKDTLELTETVKKLDLDGIEFKYIIVDKTPGDYIGDHLKDAPSYLEILQAGVDKGFAGSYTLGMRYAAAWGADYIAIINNDTLIGNNNLIKHLAAVLDENPEASVVSPKIYFAKGFEFFKSRYSKKDEGRVIWYAGGSFDWGNVRSVHKGIDEVDNKGKYDKTGKTGFISGCCFMVRRETLETAGYFDEDFFAYFEDNDWQERVRRSGGKLYYTGRTHIYHKVSQTMGVGSPQTDYLLTRNRLYFTFRYASARTKFAVAREAFRQLLFGRIPQKRAIADFLFDKKGPSPYTKISTGEYKYPIRMSILVSDYKTSDLTDQLIKSVFRKGSGYDPERDELIVLDNATDDDFEALMKKYPKGVRFIRNKINKGFVGGYNRLMEYARGELLFMLNSDIEVKDDALKTLIEQSEKYNHEYVLSGQLLFPNGDPQDSCFMLPTVWGAFKQYFLNIKGSYFMFRPEVSKPVRVEGAAMAVFMIPRKVINKIGYLNRKLFMYFEDIDYCRRLKKADIPIYYLPNSKYFHHHGATAKRIGKAIINPQLIASSKIYHGKLNYALVTSMLWLGQKWGQVISPSSRWEKDKNE